MPIRMKRKPRSRKRRSYRKRIMRVPRTIRPVNVMNYKRTFWLENWTFSAASTSGFWKYYSLTASQIPNLTELTQIFDNYKISALKYTFRPRFDNFAGNDTVDSTLPGVTNQHGNYMHIIVDPRSSFAPFGTYTSTTLNTFFENGNVKSYQGLRPFSVYFKPTVESTIGATNTARRVRSPWIQNTVTGIPHFGFHAFQQDVNLTGTTGQSYDVFVTVYMKWKGSR